MHTVVETPAYLKAADKAGMSQVEREAAVSLLANNPESGDIIAGGGGVRKVRVPKQGQGKSGGYRVLTYYMTENEPVFLISVINKSKQANLSDGQRAIVKEAAKEIRDDR
ncbi:type II toxin-antitoxin system RelE/ParE family toxin [Sphingobium boeckii]|uniref:Addiction module toxin RelE n=1 Tax=Sphingobium boeckii TaxID=1082345 RepID=A0A7W9AFV6_9SPHN|nr:type II toxin-antitoxin system RelE/ParE family toxin [Sphingobium boeckii]MBB5684691.1 hypothetical protein [Sphingobium boeckii]